MTQNLSNYATTWSVTDGKVEVVYHHTKIVEATDQDVILRTGGWKTVTTKRKMNQASHQFGLGYHVFQKNNEWYVTTRLGQTFKFNGDTVRF